MEAVWRRSRAPGASAALALGAGPGAPQRGWSARRGAWRAWPWRRASAHAGVTAAARRRAGCVVQGGVRARRVGRRPPPGARPRWAPPAGKPGGRVVPARGTCHSLTQTSRTRARSCAATSGEPWPQVQHRVKYGGFVVLRPSAFKFKRPRPRFVRNSAHTQKKWKVVEV
ncbi:Protein of unknown function [Gryllus bimaculatus]|nr:Protein of unknown function [Gryllus bimaculatus]